MPNYLAMMSDFLTPCVRLFGFGCQIF